MKTDRPWPRMMRRVTAAAYLDLSEAAFERAMSKGQLPMPVMLSGQERWSRPQIDDAVERLSRDAGPDYRANSNFYLENPSALLK